MNLRIKIFIIFLILISAFSVIGYLSGLKPSGMPTAKHFVLTRNIVDDDSNTHTHFKQKASLLTKYAKANNFNITHCFIMDMSIASGKKRFFVYNLKKDLVECSGLVAHGSGSDSANNGLYFSNKPNSNCTSLGKYKIGRPYYGKFGLAYKLYGLDQTNSNAFNRFVVLHAHSCIPDREVGPLEICRSWGCPTVSPAFLIQLKSYMDKSEQPMLLWIFE